MVIDNHIILCFKARPLALTWLSGLVALHFRSHIMTLDQRQRHRRQILCQTILIDKPCQYCWQTFTPTRSNAQLYCSYKCKQAILKEQTKDWQDRQKQDGRLSTYYKLRFDVFRRDNFICQYCGRSPQTGAILHADHIKPKKHGGKFILENLITSCQECNLGKTDVLLDAEQEKRIKREISK